MSDSTTQRGSGRLVKDDVNVMFWYIQDKDGKTVSGKRVKAMRAHARHIWSHLLSISKLPDKWSNATSVIFPGWRTTYITNKAPIKLESDIDDDLDDNVTKADNNEHGLVVGNKSTRTSSEEEQISGQAESAEPEASHNPRSEAPNFLGFYSWSLVGCTSTPHRGSSAAIVPPLSSTTSGSVSALTASSPVVPDVSSTSSAASSASSVPPAISSEVSSIPTPPPIPPPVAAPPSPDHTALDLLAGAALRTDVPIEKPISQGEAVKCLLHPGRSLLKVRQAIPVAGPSMVDNPLAHLGQPSGPTTRAEFVVGGTINTQKPAKSATDFMRVTKTNSAKNLCLKKYIEDNGEVTKEVFNAYFDSLGKAQLKVFQDASKQANKAKKDQTAAAPRTMSTRFVALIGRPR
ncbi:hypothetical protein B0H14DRAFT_3156139 [Mycena olivaceomarginata]|nr:hypothetical protein B0H14DRAFT_3156139 [Mycena olivaceomarginata]